MRVRTYDEIDPLAAFRLGVVSFGSAWDEAKVRRVRAHDRTYLEEFAHVDDPSPLSNPDAADAWLDRTTGAGPRMGRHPDPRLPGEISNRAARRPGGGVSPHAPARRDHDGRGRRSEPSGLPGRDRADGGEGGGGNRNGQLDHRAVRCHAVPKPRIHGRRSVS